MVAEELYGILQEPNPLQSILTVAAGGAPTLTTTLSVAEPNEDVQVRV